MRVKINTFTFTYCGNTYEVEAEDMPSALDQLSQEHPDDYRRFTIAEAGPYSGYGTVGKLMTDMRRLLGC